MNIYWKVCCSCVILGNSCKVNPLRLTFRQLSLSYNTSQKCSKTKKKQTVEGPPWKILFFGTDRFSLESLKPLCAKLRTGTLMSSLGVVTKKGSKIREFAEAEKLPIHDWPLETADIAAEYDLGMVVSFGNLIPENIINGLPLGCINVHASLLPRWRGASPIIHSILTGDTETGVTIMRIHPHRFDIGEIVRQYRVPIGLDETAQELEQKLAVLGSQLLMECLRDLPRCIEKAVPQPQQGITHAPKINNLLANVDWNKMGANSVYNLHRALHHVYPLSTRWRDRSLKLQDIVLDKDLAGNRQDSQTSQESAAKSALAFLNSSDFESDRESSKQTQTAVEPGRVEYLKDQKCLRVSCSDNRFVLVRKISVSGKTMSATDFYNGFLTKVDESEWRFIV